MNKNNISNKNDKKDKEKINIFGKLNKRIKRLFCTHYDSTLTILTLHGSNNSYHTHVCKLCGKSIENPNKAV